jgi:uncharacterized membrane protein YbhN (UPF0104 family)
MLLMLFGAPCPPLMTWIGSDETVLMLLFLFALLPAELAISALILSRSTSAAWDFLSVFFTKPVMITLQRMSTSSRR